MQNTKIGFTGHRDGRTDEAELDKIRDQYPGAEWWHGDNSAGFDAQVRAYCEKNGIPQVKCPPLYEDFAPEDRRWRAPLSRNKTIVYNTDFLVACYDGRNYGGTKFTIRTARRVNKRIVYVSCIKGDEQ